MLVVDNWEKKTVDQKVYKVRVHKVNVNTNAPSNTSNVEPDNFSDGSGAQVLCMEVGDGNLCMMIGDKRIWRQTCTLIPMDFFNY